MFTMRRSLLRDLMRSKLGGMPGIARAWPQPFSVPDRTTLWRWFNGRSQITPALILPLAGTFDLDPFALFEITPPAYAALCRALAKGIGAGRGTQLARDLQWLSDLVAPREDWPPNEIASRYFHRPWVVKPFRHTAQYAQNFFQRLLITAPVMKFREPQVWHFAFRGQNPSFQLWVPYGFIEKRPNQIALYHYRGNSTSVDVSAEASTFIVETWFGLGTAEFRAASIHKFDLALIDSADLALPCVRFP